MKKTLAIATVLIAAALTGILSTSPIAFAQDESETNTEQEIKQKNVGSGESTNNNCALNSIDTALGATVTCTVGPLLGIVDGKLEVYD
jgi:hypothetical protein